VPPLIVVWASAAQSKKPPLAGKHSLCRRVGEHNDDAELAVLELELLEAINRTVLARQG